MSATMWLARYLIFGINFDFGKGFAVGQLSGILLYWWLDGRESRKVMARYREIKHEREQAGLPTDW